MAQTTPLPLPPFKKRSKRGLIVAIIFCIVLFSGVGTYAYVTYYLPLTKEKEIVTDKGEVEVDSVVAKVQVLIELPDEEPTLATVSDVEKLKDQAFFANAQNGDKVLIFQKAEKAILYRPSTNKIIEVGPITITLPVETAPQGTTSPEGRSESATITKPLDLVLYNGTATVGITTRAEEDVTALYPTVTVLEKENAKDKTYKETLVIDLTGKRTSDAELLAELFSATITTLPENEASPKADFLIILGSEYAIE